MCQCPDGVSAHWGGRHGVQSFKKLHNAIIAFVNIRSVIEVNGIVLRSCGTSNPEAFCPRLNVSENVINSNMILVAPLIFTMINFLNSFGPGREFPCMGTHVPFVAPFWLCLLC